LVMNNKAIKSLALNIAGYEKLTLDRVSLVSLIREEKKVALADMDNSEKETFCKALAKELESVHKIAHQRVSELLISFGFRRRASAPKGVKIADGIINQIVELAEKLAPKQESVALYRAWVKKKEEKKATKKPASK